MLMNFDVVVLTYYDDKEVFDKTVNSVYKAFETAKDYLRLNDFIIIGEEVKGRGRARDVGWRRGKSEFIVFVDTGVVLSNDWLVEMHKAMKIVGGDVWFGDSSEAGNPRYLMAKCREIEISEVNDRFGRISNYVQVQALDTSNSVFRRNILEKVEGFDVNRPFGEDREISYRIIKTGGEIFYVHKAKATNTHRTRFRAKLKQSWEVGRSIAYIMREYRNIPIHWGTYILLPYSCIKRIFTWGLKYGWKGSFASLVYFFKTVTKGLGIVYGYIYRVNNFEFLPN
jgi:cellulose synthase/poly-beta-1,6-N-acetylglucosamine synthase-like glycosyltransferase